MAARDDWLHVLQFAQSVPVDLAGAVVLIASLLLTAVWLYYLFR